jgi:hypothetical protein
MSGPDRGPSVRDNAGRRHRVSAQRLPGGSMVTTHVTAPDGTPRRGLATSWPLDEAEIYAIQILVAVARGRVLDELAQHQDALGARHLNGLQNHE